MKDYQKALSDIEIAIKQFEAAYSKNEEFKPLIDNAIQVFTDTYADYTNHKPLLRNYIQQVLDDYEKEITIVLQIHRSGEYTNISQSLTEACRNLKMIIESCARINEYYDLRKIISIATMLSDNYLWNDSITKRSIDILNNECDRLLKKNRFHGAKVVIDLLRTTLSSLSLEKPDLSEMSSVESTSVVNQNLLLLPNNLTKYAMQNLLLKLTLTGYKSFGCIIAKDFAFSAGISSNVIMCKNTFSSIHHNLNETTNRLESINDYLSHYIIRKESENGKAH